MHLDVEQPECLERKATHTNFYDRYIYMYPSMSWWAIETNMSTGYFRWIKYAMDNWPLTIKNLFESWLNVASAS